MTEQPKILTVTFQLKDEEIEAFNRAFLLSGFRSKSELIRFILNNELPNYYGDKK